MKFTLTLSRWHKVAERMNAALKERESNVRTGFTATTISPWNKEGIEEKAAEIAHRAAEDLALIEAGSRAVARIRGALALRNAELGISGRLAEVEAAKRRATLYRSVIEGQKADMVRAQGVRALPGELIGESDSWGLSRRTAMTVTLQTADRELLEALREKLAGDLADSVRVLDEIADLNRDKLEIEVPQEVLGIAGLAA